MVRIGIVDLDTPHAGSLTGLLRQHDDLAISAVWDGRAVYPAGYAEQFAAENGIEHVCESVEEMAGLVDLALVLGVDWDFHLMRSEPFVEAGKMIYIDSPAAGKAAHCARLLEWEEKGARIMTGGAARFCKEIEETRRGIADFGEIVSVFASAPPDFFGRGIHIAEVIGAVLGPGVIGVKFIGSRDETSLFLIDYDGGPVCIMQLASPGHEICLSICGPTSPRPWTIWTSTCSSGPTCLLPSARTCSMRISAPRINNWPL